MKKRSMILALASMLGISAAATAVSGFAWFTTMTTASVNAGSYKVAAAQGSLKVEGVDDTDVNCGCTVSGNAATIVPTESRSLADVSSADGKDFYKLYDIQGIDGTAGTATTATLKKEAAMPANGNYLSSVNNTQMIAISWSLKVTNDATGGPAMDVFLTSDEADLFKKTTNDATNDYVNAYRMAVYNDSTLVYLYSKSTTAMTSWTNGGSLDGTANAIAAKDDSITAISSAATAAADLTEGAGTQILLKGLAAGSDATLKFVVWCEGTQTPDSQLTNTANTVTCNFGLIGLAAQ